MSRPDKRSYKEKLGKQRLCHGIYIDETENKKEKNILFQMEINAKK